MYTYICNYFTGMIKRNNQTEALKKMRIVMYQSDKIKPRRTRYLNDIVAATVGVVL